MEAEHAIVGNVAMKKLILHETTKWVDDLLNAKAEPGELTTLKESLAEHLGISRTKLFTILRGNPKGERKFTTAQIIQIAEFFGVDPPKGYGKSAIASAPGSNVIPLHPPIPENGGGDGTVYPVAGVLFARFADRDKVKQPKINQFVGPKNKKYPNAKHVAWESSDLSMNERKVFEDTYVLCVDFNDTGGNLENGMVVVVERTRGMMVERPLREVVVTPSGVEFHPRTSCPDEDFTSFSLEGDEHTKVKVLSVMVGTYRDEP